MCIKNYVHIYVNKKKSIIESKKKMGWLAS